MAREKVQVENWRKMCYHSSNGGFTMKRIIAFILCFTFIFLCSCSNKDDDVTTNHINYVNEGEWSGIQREMVTDWFAGEVSGAVKEDLPEGFPAVPEETSNISITKHSPEDTNNGYTSDWLEVVFSAPRQSVNKFSDDLKKAGYTGTARFLASQGWQGAWQNGKNVIRIASWEYEYDGSYIITLHITDCLKPSYPELEAIVPVFDGATSSKGTYYELRHDGSALKHDFDGMFHAEWQIEYSLNGSIVGTTKDAFEEYTEKLDANGFEGQKSFYSTTDDCIVYFYEGVNEETDLFVAAYLNESLMTLEIRYTNVIPESETETE